jgi:hypothetical protein
MVLREEGGAAADGLPVAGRVAGAGGGAATAQDAGGRRWRGMQGSGGGAGCRGALVAQDAGAARRGMQGPVAARDAGASSGAGFMRRWRQPMQGLAATARPTAGARDAAGSGELGTRPPARR